jgi:hypothetical protein
MYRKAYTDTLYCTLCTETSRDIETQKYRNTKHINTRDTQTKMHISEVELFW